MYDLARFYGTKVSFYKGTDSYKSYKLVQTSNFSVQLMPYYGCQKKVSKILYIFIKVTFGFGNNVEPNIFCWNTLVRERRDSK